MANRLVFNPFTSTLDYIGEATVTNEYPDNLFRVIGSGDVSKKLAFEVDGIATTTTRTITVGNENINISTGASGSFANATLSNLDAPTAVNEDLLPSGTKNLGSSTAVWNETYSDNVISNTNLILRSKNTGGTDSPTATLKSGDSTSGDSGAVVVRSGVSTGSTSGTWSGGSGNAAVSAGVTLSSGTGSVSSGSVTLSPGASGSRGKIKFVDGSEGTASQLWTSSATDGSGGWAAPSFSDSVFRITDNGDATKKLAFEVSAITTGTTRTITMPDSNLNLSTSTSGSFANVNLSNLGVTSINSDLLPSADNTRKIGSSSLTWSEAFIDIITAASPLTLRSIAEAGTTGAVSILSGNSSGANSGDVNLTTGTAAGARGRVIVDALRLTTACDIRPDDDDLRSIGTNSVRYVNGYIKSLFSNTLVLGENTGAADILIQNFGSPRMRVGEATLPSGGTSNAVHESVGSGGGGMALFSANGTSSNNVRIESGNASAGSSGSIILRPGTATVTRGKIKFTDGSEGTSGHLWTSSATDGSGAWVSPASTGLVSGPASSTDNAVARYDGTTGKIIQNSSTTIDDGGVIATVANASVPTYTFTGDLDTGMGSDAADNLYLSTGGPGRLFINTTRIRSSLPLYLPSGTAAAPTLTFQSDSTTGFYLPAAAQIGFSTSGTARMILDNTGLNPFTNEGYDLGSTSNRFSNVWAQTIIAKNSGTFILSDASDNTLLDIRSNITTPSGAGSTQGIRSVVQGVNFSLTSNSNATVNATATPSLYFETGNKTGAASTGNSGLINIQTGTAVDGNSGNINIQTGTSSGGTRGTITLNGSSVISNSILALPVTASGTPALTFTGDLDTGFSSNAANSIQFITAGANRFLIDTTKTTITLPLRESDGSAAAPSYSWTNSPDTGMFLPATSVIGISTAGTSRVEFNNTDMHPTTNLGYVLGSSSNYFSGVISQSFNPKNNGAITFLTSGDVAQMSITVSTDTPSGVNAHNIRSREVGKAMAVYTENNGSNNSTATDDVLIETGNKTHVTATGNSGNIKLTPGTVTLGTRGTVQVFGSGLVLSNIAADPTGAVAGQIYYNTTVNKIKMYNGTTWETVTSI